MHISASARELTTIPQFGKEDLRVLGRSLGSLDLYNHTGTCRNFRIFGSFWDVVHMFRIFGYVFKRLHTQIPEKVYFQD